MSITASLHIQETKKNIFVLRMCVIETPISASYVLNERMELSTAVEGGGREIFFGEKMHKRSVSIVLPILNLAHAASNASIEKNGSMR